MHKASVIIPAYNEADYLPLTLVALKKLSTIGEIIVVDDGSNDDTFHVARRFTEHVIRLPINRGKGAALEAGWKQATHPYLLFLDADLGASATHAELLLQPVIDGKCDMAVALLPKSNKKSGLGFVKRTAQMGINRLTHRKMNAPLSGQRALHRDMISYIQNPDCRFGIEISMTIDLLQAGFHIIETPVPFSHRVSGNNLPGFLHRGQEWCDITRVLVGKWRSEGYGK
ncbi:glycosyltransferase family 2 protein [Brevibacillus daliensis]|uniref:glycosyltransferase family 2 protein n=1 Tax=Brevibacillus daliensis TaxID=2892995 RepID=UPI001E5FDAAC|nr:glycosyltransferase family 2 protein [Brevibacillus daliensis]